MATSASIRDIAALKARALLFESTCRVNKTLSPATWPSEHTQGALNAAEFVDLVKSRRTYLDSLPNEELWKGFRDRYRSDTSRPPRPISDTATDPQGVLLSYLNALDAMFFFGALTQPKYVQTLIEGQPWRSQVRNFGVSLKDGVCDLKGAVAYWRIETGDICLFTKSRVDDRQHSLQELLWIASHELCHVAITILTYENPANADRTKRYVSCDGYHGVLFHELHHFMITTITAQVGEAVFFPEHMATTARELKGAWNELRKTDGDNAAQVMRDAFRGYRKPRA